MRHNCEFISGNSEKKVILFKKSFYSMVEIPRMLSSNYKLGGQMCMVINKFSTTIVNIIPGFDSLVLK